MTTLNYAVALRPIRYWIKDMKRTLSLSAIMLMTTPPVFAESIIRLDEIVVYGTLAETELWKTGSALDIIDSSKLAETPSTSLTTLLKGIPGVSTNQSGAFGGTAYISLRGLPSAYIKTNKDGIDITDPTAIKTEFGDIGELVPSSISAIQILKGTQSAVYGSSAVGGVMELKSIDLANAPDGTHQQVDFSLGSQNTKTGRYQFTRTENDTKLGFSASFYDTDGISSASSGREADSFKIDSFALAYSKNLSDDLEVGANIFKENSYAEFDELAADFVTPIDGTPDDYKTRDSIGARIFAKYKLANWEHETSISNYKVKRVLIQPSQVFNIPSRDEYEGNRTFAQYVAKGQISENLNFSFGIDTEIETAKTTSISGGSKSATTSGVFSEAQYLLNNNWAIMANLRHDNHEKFGGFDSYRLSTSYRIDAKTVIRAQRSSGFRAPSMAELYSSYPVWNFFGNPNVKPETFVTNEVTLNRELGNMGNLSIAFFETNFETRIASNDNTYFNQASNSSVKGSEFGLRTPLGENTSFALAYTAMTKKEMSGDRAPGQTLNFLLEHEFSENFKGLMEVTSISDQPAKSGVVRNDYKLLNLAMHYRLNKTLNLHGKIENVSDYQYETEPGYGSAGRTILVGVSANF